MRRVPSTTVRTRGCRRDEQAVRRRRVLLAALRAGDEEAFGWLLDTYSAHLHRLARSFVRTQGAAEEVVQETWLAVISGIGRFEARSSVKTWIYRILMNQARGRGARDNRAVPSSALAGDDERS